MRRRVPLRWPCICTTGQPSTTPLACSSRPSLPADKLLSKWHVKRARLDRLLLQQQDAEEKLRKLEQEEAQEEAAAGTGGSGPIGSGATGSGSSGAIGSEGTGNGAVTNRAISNVRTVSGSGGAMGSSSGAIRSSASGALASGSGAFDSGAIAGSGSREDAADAEAAPARRAWACCGGGDAAAARRKQMAKLSARLTKLADEVLGAETALADLQGQIEEEQEVAAEALPAPCFFATFHSAQAAAYAARLNLNPMHERMMRWVKMGIGDGGEQWTQPVRMCCHVLRRPPPRLCSLHLPSCIPPSCHPPPHIVAQRSACAGSKQCELLCPDARLDGARHPAPGGFTQNVLAVAA